MSSLLHLLFFLFFFLNGCFGEFEYGDLIGCYQDLSPNRDLSHQIQIESIATPYDCIDKCLTKYYRYSGIQENSCFCGNTYGAHGPGECNILCPGNKNQTCGGNNSSSVYATGQKENGPPLNLRSINKTEHSISITSDSNEYDQISYYIVKVKYLNTYASKRVFQNLELTYTNITPSVRISNLFPGTEYNISLSAKNKYGEGIPAYILERTIIGDPEYPKVPKIIKKQKDQIIIHLEPVINEKGPISKYQIVVITDGEQFSLEDQHLLTDWKEAKSQGLPYYITAELEPSELKIPRDFIVGDGRTYGKYYNSPLSENDHIHITLGVVSSMNGVTKASYASVNHEQHGVFVLDVTGVESSPGLVLGLSIAIVFFGLLLLLSIVVYFVIRHKLGKRRPLTEHQELSLQSPITETPEIGFIHEGFIPEEEYQLPNHYENLKHQVWNIPRNFLEVSTDILGKGKYGWIYKGTVQQKGYPVSVAIYNISDGQLGKEKKREMLQDLNVLIKAGSHQNIISLIGTHETSDILYIVLEIEQNSLKNILLESRKLDHSSNHRFCTLPESFIIETCIGIVQGMEYLNRKKIIHKRLISRNIFMSSGKPKIGMFGIAEYNIDNEIPDYTRWTAQEIFRNRAYVYKSDVWSFGCVMWEMSVIGGTPYAEIQNHDVANHVTRGQRLVQKQYISDDLYMLMLQCWQNDLDERPTFSELLEILEPMVEDSSIHLNYSFYNGFHYEAYVKEYEIKIEKS